MLPYCILTLHTEVDRQAHITREFKRYELEPIFFYGIDARKMSLEELQTKTIEPGILKAGEIGCALSHLAIYQKMVDDNIPALLILEDDINLTDEFINALPQIESFVHTMMIDTNALLLLNKPYQLYTPIYPISNQHTIHTAKAGEGTYAYIITQKAAKNIIKIQTPIRWQIDFWKFMYYTSAIRLYALNSPIVELHQTSSIINSMCKENRDRPDYRPLQKRLLNCLCTQENALYLLFRYLYLKNTSPTN